MTMPAPLVGVADREGARTLALRNPPKNLLHPEMMGDLVRELRAADAAEDVSGIILTGEGEVFCGGLDLAALRAGGDPVEFAGALVELVGVLPTLGTPVAAAVNGDAVASGASIVAACDFAVAVPHARLGTFEVSVGIWPMVAQVPLIHRLGPRAAMENVGSGEPFSAERALQVGLVNDLAPSAELDGRVRRWLGQAARAGAAARRGRPAFYELADRISRRAAGGAGEVRRHVRAARPLTTVMACSPAAPRE